MDSRGQTLRLINAVKERPILYDTTLDVYRNTTEKKLVWQEVAEQIGGKDGETISWKWKNLRDSYAKYLRSQHMPHESPLKRLMNWRWAEYMRFVDPFMRIMKDVNDQSNTSTDAKAIRHKRPKSLKRPRSNSTCNTQDESSSDLNISENQCKVERIESNSYSEVGTVEEYVIDNSASTQEQQFINNSEKLDKIDYLFLNYAETFKKLSPRRQAILKLQMAKMFAEAELREMDPIKLEIT